MERMDTISGLYLSWAQGTALYGRYAEKRGITYSELMVLYVLEGSGALTQREVALQGELTKQTVNQVVRRFREARLLVLGPDGADRRRKVITFTEAGRRYAEDIIGPLHAMEEKVFRLIGPERLEAMKETSDLFNVLFAKELSQLG